jgi:uncharacterized membrane protein
MRWEIDTIEKGCKMCPHHDAMLFLKGMLMLLVFALLVVLFVRLLQGRCPFSGKCMKGKCLGKEESFSALSLLEERYAKGEINTEEFNEKKNTLLK